jgi:hypothetical protein
MMEEREPTGSSVTKRKVYREEDCRGVLFDCYLIDGEYHDKAIYDLSRRRRKVDRTVTPASRDPNA